jgi:hypothetical protein
LEKLKKMENWPEKHKDWLSPANFELYRRYPSGRPGWGWYNVWQIIPRAGSRLKQILGTFWIGFCKVQIFILDGEGERKHLMIGRRNQYNELVATDPLRSHVQNMAEAYGSADYESSYCGSTSYAGSSSAAAVGPWATNDVGTDWREAFSTADVSTTVPSGPGCSSSSVVGQEVLLVGADGDEFYDARLDEAPVGAAVPHFAGGVAVATPATPAVETEAERRRRLAAEAAMRRGS